MTPAHRLIEPIRRAMERDGLYGRKPAMSKWISTNDKAAPKDGTICWLAAPPDGKARSKERTVTEGYWLDGAWRSTEFGDDELWPPTHWMISRNPPPPKPFTLPKRR